jgi:hypothetical protein
MRTRAIVITNPIGQSAMEKLQELLDSRKATSKTVKD